MSRFCGEKKVEPLFRAAQHWKEKSLLSNSSVIARGAIWTLSNLETLEQHFVNQSVEGGRDFFEKLEIQLDPVEPRVKQLAAEMLWFMLLCPSNIRQSKKRENIKRIWGWSGETFPEDSEWITDDVLGGAGSAGISFNTNRWRELAFFIRVGIAFKTLTKRERELLLYDGWKFARWLEKVPECNTRQLRHMFLFLLFPDNFERIFGGKDRKKVVQAFSTMSLTQIKKLTPLEIDQNLFELREKKEAELGTKEIDFYVPPLRRLWIDSKVKTWLFSWNPTNWKWGNFSHDRTVTHEGKVVTHRWGCANKKVSNGDKAFLAKTGEAPNGIIAIGKVVSDPFQAPHWDEEKADQGKLYRYVNVELSRIQDPLQNDPYITKEDFKSSITDDKKIWLPRASGVVIKQNLAGILEKKWERIVEAELGSYYKKRHRKSSEAVNQILYGPPGTGKTYQLQQLAKKYSSRKQFLSRDAWLIQELQDATWFDVIFGAIHDMEGKAKVKVIRNHEYVQIKKKIGGRTRNIEQTIWAELQAHASEESSTVNYKNRRPPFVFDKDTDSVWSLFGNWKEECEELVEKVTQWKAGPKQKETNQRYVFVTFHQSYSYEDFVEGIRPVHDEETGNINYPVKQGVFKKICQWAKANPEQRYAIFIDEINRGNIAKIFGELITLIEEDKRAIYSDTGDLVRGMELTLPYTDTRFSVPGNLDIYGAMNTADRSIALLDTALRRRFQFKEMLPDASVIGGLNGDGYIKDGVGGFINLRALMEAMNCRIRLLLNRDMTLGHAFFTKVENFEDLKKVLFAKIIPLLQEYFYEDWRRIQLVFRDVGPEGEKHEPQIVCHEILNEEEVLGFDNDDFRDVGPEGEKHEPQIVCHEILNEEEVLGFDNDDFDDLTEYRVADPDEITPDAVRKVYEEST